MGEGGYEGTPSPRREKSEMTLNQHEIQNDPDHIKPASSNGTACDPVDMESKPLDQQYSAQAPPIIRRKNRSKSLDLDDYFQGPRSIDKHSKWPLFMRMHGSIFPELILPITLFGLWATLHSCISHFIYPLGVDNILLTVLGFTISLAISFRSSTSYERYGEGRKYWAQLMLVSQTLARDIWVSAEEREGEEGKEDVLNKLSALNLIVAFANALKHKLRFEPYMHYEDLHGLIQHLDTFAKEAEDPALLLPQRKSAMKRTGEYLGISMAQSNPRKLLKRANKPVGNLPLEILSYLSRYVDSLIETESLKSYHQVQCTLMITQLNDILVGTERVLNTPLPIAYSICISQITMLYCALLPFQLWPALEWISIPATCVSAYIILGFEYIGRELENPYGSDVNDLPLDDYCNQIASEIDIIASAPPPNIDSFFARQDNLVLFPFSQNGYQAWAHRSMGQIRERLRARPHQTMEQMADAKKAAHEHVQKKKRKMKEEV
ncbi:Bestrophin, RFP-TM, chloride channel-domain-containing protein [Phyllosticta capitalensis]|uniref:Bestrophin, RFP-TM, chloride channel-domain-containing protein n=1 Tax=Phyllosticta capitalensis TaxID=121624 RepID=A0ABR1YB63_9PEZI